MPTMPRLDALGIVVRDMGEARRFYAHLGVVIPEGDDDHLEAVMPNGLRLMFDTVELMQQFTHWEEPSGHRMGLAFLCDSPAEVDATCESMRQSGFQVAKEPWDAFWGQRYAQVADPDGNLVDLFAPLG